MLTEEGDAKGLRIILRERGINTVNMRADHMRTVLSNHEDFSQEKNGCGALSSSKGSPSILSTKVPLRTECN